MDAMNQLKLSPEAQAFPHEAVTPASIEAVQAIPIWMAVGRRDHAISVSRIEDCAASFGGCPYVIIENAGHFIQEDAPETVVALLQTFIQATGGGVPRFEKSVGVPPPGSRRL